MASLCELGDFGASSEAPQAQIAAFRPSARPGVFPDPRRFGVKPKGRMMPNLNHHSHHSCRDRILKDASGMLWLQKLAPQLFSGKSQTDSQSSSC